MLRPSFILSSLFLCASLLPTTVVANIFDDVDLTVKEIVNVPIPIVVVTVDNSTNTTTNTTITPPVPPIAGILIEFQLEGIFDDEEFTNRLPVSLVKFQNDIKRKTNKLSIKKNYDSYEQYLSGNQTGHLWVKEVLCIHPYSCQSEYTEEGYQCERLRCDISLQHDENQTPQEAQYNMLKSMDMFFSLGTSSFAEVMSFIGPFPDNSTFGIQFNGVSQTPMNENQTKFFELALTDLMMSEFSTAREWYRVASVDVRNVRVGRRGADLRWDVEILSLHGQRVRRFNEQVMGLLSDEGASEAFVAMLAASEDPYFTEWADKNVAVIIEDENNAAYQRAAVGGGMAVASAATDDAIVFKEMQYDLVGGIIAIFVSTTLIALVYRYRSKFEVLPLDNKKQSHPRIIELDSTDELQINEANCVVNEESEDNLEPIISETVENNNELCCQRGIRRRSRTDNIQNC